MFCLLVYCEFILITMSFDRKWAAYCGFSTAVTKVHLKSRGTDCKIGDNFLNLRGIVNLSLGIPSSHKELNF